MGIEKLPRNTLIDISHLTLQQKKDLKPIFQKLGFIFSKSDFNGLESFIESKFNFLYLRHPIIGYNSTYYNPENTYPEISLENFLKNYAPQLVFESKFVN
ncbi:MAG: hypothetical protein AABY22_07125 [Nanoarchaeota archaeon]